LFYLQKKKKKRTSTAAKKKQLLNVYMLYTIACVTVKQVLS